MDRLAYTKKVQEIIAKVLPLQGQVEVVGENTPLTGSVLDVNSVNFVYIVLEIMKEFNVRFDAADFENYSFNTVAGIVNALEKHLG